MQGKIIIIQFLVISIAMALSACAKPEPPAGNPEQSIPAPTSSGSPVQRGTPLAVLERSAGNNVKPPAPERDEVQTAVRRIFKEVVELDTGRNPNFAAGDFNADGSQDLAIMIKPTDAETSYLELNNELANWLIREPRKIVVPKALAEARAGEVRAKPGLIRKGEELMAVIHGYGPQGWRNPEARQTFLLKGVAGDNMRSESVNERATGKWSFIKLKTIQG